MDLLSKHEANFSRSQAPSGALGERSQPFFKPLIQPKLTVNEPNDIYEQQADAMADKVMRMPEPSLQQNTFFKSVIPSIQRKCAECEEEEKQHLQRKEINNAEAIANDESDAYAYNLSGGGTSLPKEIRSFFEPRMGYDFSNVKVHTDSPANKAAQSINALAYTHGNNIVFGKGQYAPDTENGKRLLGHELTHVVQQSQLPNATASVQRALVVNPRDVVPLASGASGTPLPLTTAVQGMLNELCADGRFRVDRTGGNVTLADPEFCQDWHPPMLPDIRRVNNSTTPAGCRCLCNVVNDTQTTTIGFSPGGPSTGPGSVTGAGPGQGGVRTDATVSIDPRFRGQYRINGRWVDLPFYLLFSHELCGHALPKMQGTHVARGAAPQGGTPPQEQHAVYIEREIAREHGLPRRPDDYSGDARQRP